jgi:predicted helicase
MPDYNAVKSIRDFRSLVRYLREQLDWPIEENHSENDVFDYDPVELGINDGFAVKIREIKQIRPLVHGQQWGVFWIGFESKRLPVVVMRRILAALVYKKRANGRTARQATWSLRDLLFISATGENNARGISFAHFCEISNGIHQLRTFSWDANEHHFYYLEKLNLEALRWPDNAKDIEGWRRKWSEGFTSAHREVIATSQQLASRLAAMASAIRALVKEVYDYEKLDGPLHKLYDSFKQVLIHDLSADDFADMYAQTVTYGLFSAATTSHAGEFTLENAVNLIPNTNPFLRGLFAECLKVGTTGKHQIDLDELGVGELIQLLRKAKMDAILRDFGRQTRNEDPIIHFYESFLNEYDAHKKIQRGVFYTPDPVVSFIIRSVNCLLRTQFNCLDGLADGGIIKWNNKTFPHVQILDPATGTGTFLKHVIEQIYDTFCAKHKQLRHVEQKKKWNEYVSQNLLPRLYGFELMMAPYSVAHLKLGLMLKETGYDFASIERLHVYLTNTLEEETNLTQKLPFMQWLAEEASAAARIKRNVPITVIVGNPPYSGISANNSVWIDGLLKGQLPDGTKVDSYYEVDGKPLGERKVWLQDDYVKFIRFGQWLLDRTGLGILAFITNHGFLDNPTFRGMRQSLMRSFSEIYLFDLHGNTKKGERAPDNSIDQNVFDIQQGVAISVFVKRPGQIGQAKVYHADLWGSREHKYEQLRSSSGVTDDRWQEIRHKIEPNSPYYFFVPRVETHRKEYEEFWKITEIMPTNTSGIVTARDSFVFDFDESTLLRRIQDFRDERLSDEEIRKKYFGQKGSSKYPDGDTRGWKLPEARRKSKGDKAWKDRVRPCLYRPFDTRPLYYSEWMIDWPRTEVMRHMLAGNNLALITSRLTKGESFKHIQVSRSLVEVICMSPKTSNNGFVFPLYLEEQTQHKNNNQVNALDTKISRNLIRRRHNFAKSFITDIEKCLSLHFLPEGVGDLKKTFGPEDIFHYMYSIFYSPTYRERYAEFLKIDFPRLPLTSSLSLFRKLAGKGKELVALHLLEFPTFNNPIAKFVGKGSNEVASGYPKYDDETVWINATQGFEGVPKKVWEFHIGGYQVCQKWLKDRRGRALSAEDKTHYAKTVVALHETIRLMREIDSAIEEHGGWLEAFDLSQKN